MPLRRAVVALLLAGSAAATLAPAQRQPLPPPGGFGAAAGAGAASLDAALEGLLRLPGAHVVVLYPPDHLDRAARLQLRLEGLRRAWQPLTRHDLEWRAALVGATRWRQLAPGAPWGWPARAAGPLFVIPVRADAEIVAAVTALLGGAPPDPGGDPLVGSRDEAGAVVVVDLLAQLEAARELADAARWRGDEPWIRDLLVHLALRYAWETREPAAVPGYVDLFDRIAAAHGGPAARRLEEFQPGLPREIDLWYQAQLVRGADVLWVDRGAFRVARLLDRWSDHGEPLLRAELEKRFPGLVDWRRRAFAP